MNKIKNKYFRLLFLNIEVQIIEKILFFFIQKVSLLLKKFNNIYKIIINKNKVKLMYQIFFLFIIIFFTGCDNTVMQYKMDECTVDSSHLVKDSSDTENDATPKHGNSNTDQKYATPCTEMGTIVCNNLLFRGEGYNADPNNSWHGAQYYLEASDVDAISPLAEENEMTLTGWFKTTKNDGTLIAKHNEYRVFLEGGNLKVTIWDKNGSPITETIKDNVADGVWHFYAFTAEISGYYYNKKLKLKLYYGDGSSDQLENQTKTNSISGVSNTTEVLIIGAIIWNQGNNPTNYFDGYLDEFAMSKAVQTKQNLKKLYKAQKNHKDLDENGDEVERECECECNGGETPPVTHYGKFDAWDIFRDINDRNISTKIVSQSFKLTIASLNEDRTDYQEFNGTVCSRVLDINDNNLTDWVKTYFNDKNTSTQTVDGDPDFNVTKANREVKINIKWIKNINYPNCDFNENNETNSTDNFAIRPKNYTIDANTTALYAGEDFKMLYKAVDAVDENSSDYNTNNGFVLDANKTLLNCGNVSFSSPVFSDGGNVTIENLDSIGDINITIKDSNNSNSWAAVDSDDTNDSLRLIETYSKIITIKPYDINITDINITKSTDDNWLYMGTNIQDMNITLTPTLKVFSKNGVKIQEYNSSCYAEDINVTFYYDVNRSDDLNLTLDGNLTSTDTNISDINKTLQISKDSFVYGESNSTAYSFGIDRVYNSEKNVTKVRLTNINITSNTSAKYENGLAQDNNTTFYYGRIYPQDLSTSKISDSAKTKILIYNKSHISGLQEELLHWYIFTPHKESDGNITQLVSSSSTNKSSGDTDGITASSTYSGDGIFSIDVNNSNKKENTYYIHLDTQDFLWYVPNGFGLDYNDSVGSSCSEHPCIEYKYGTNTQGEGVNSGSTNGLSIDLNTSKNSRGVRLFR